GDFEGARPELAAGGRHAAARSRAVELLDEVCVERSPAKFAVGDRVQAERLLECDRFADAAVLQLAQLVQIVLAKNRLFVSEAKLRGPEQAADVVGAERR